MEKKITAADFADYWAVLNARRTATNDMGGTKAQQKTLIRELLKEARSDFPHLSIPDFPSISKQIHISQVLFNGFGDFWIAQCLRIHQVVQGSDVDAPFLEGVKAVDDAPLIPAQACPTSPPPVRRLPPGH